ncbi:MAG TPA: YfjP family GTPase [Propionibacteriaceae bacterium]|nr:YfjP family GTPase [Propionibacteriaceae bacterium]
MFTTRPNVADKVRALSDAADLASGRSDDDVVAEARRIVNQTDRRLAFAGDITVIALAGATGSGKSSLFNAVSGTKLAEPGVRRPTTSKAMAAFWGHEVPNDLLDWLEVPRRHLVTGGTSDLNGLVLLDLPDHDSTEASHRMEVDRLVKLVDMFVWVLDPQKYADAALHDRYLKPMAAHAEVMLIVLNQSDRLAPDELDRCLKDLRKLLDSEGLQKAHLLAMSALTGAGVPELRARLARSIKDKAMAARRLEADVDQIAAALRAEIGDAKTNEIDGARIRHLNKTLGEAAGVPVVTEAVLKAMRRRGTLATGWPALSWIARFRPDPLRRLHLDRLTATRKKVIEPGRVQRTSLPTTNGVQRARVDSAVRAVADEAAAGLPRGWADAVRTASRQGESTLPDQLDRAIATTDLAMDRGQGWWKVITVLQWLLIAGVVTGLGWLAVDFALAYFQMPPLPRVAPWRDIPLPSLLAIGGTLAGILLALLSRIFVEVAAQGKAARARNVLEKSIGRVAQSQIAQPVNSELSRYDDARAAIARAR